MDSYMEGARARANKLYKSLKGSSHFLLLIISFFSSIHGLLTLGVIFPTINFLFSQQVFFQIANTPADLASIEAALAGISFFTGLVVATFTLAGSAKSKNPISVGMGIVFWIALFLISIVIMIMRSSTLGYLHASSPWLFSYTGTCRDIDWRTGCPTSRLKYRLNTTDNDKLVIDDKFANPDGQIGKGGKTGKGDKNYCLFNAYDNRESIVNNTRTTNKLGYDDKDTLPTGQQLINWSNEKYYNPNLESGTEFDDLDKIANTIYIERNAEGNCEDGYLAVAANTPPFTNARCQVKATDLTDISWCWHWGCDEECNERYTINYLWWVSSLISTVFYFILTILSGAAFGAVRQETLSQDSSNQLNVSESNKSYKYTRVKRIDF